MNVYAERDYRKVLAECLREKKRIDTRLTFQQMAEAIRVQKSYLSNTLKGRAQLSSDQLFLACRFLGLGAGEAQYLQLLLEFDRSGVQERKLTLQAEIEAIQAQQLESKSQLKAKSLELTMEHIAEYHLDPTHSIIHLALTIDRYRRNPVLLAEDLGIKAERIERSVALLERCRIIRPRQAKRPIEVVIEHIHLPREAPVYSTFRNQLKQMTLARLQNSEPEDYSFWVTFSADEKSALKLRQEFLALLKKTESSVRNAPAQDVYQMTFDLFQWTRRPA